MHKRNRRPVVGSEFGPGDVEQVLEPRNKDGALDRVGAQVAVPEIEPLHPVALAVAEQIALEEAGDERQQVVEHARLLVHLDARQVEQVEPVVRFEVELNYFWVRL